MARVTPARAFPAARVWRGGVRSRSRYSGCSGGSSKVRAVEQETAARPAGPRDPAARQWPVLAVISVGGALGALARYGLGQAIPAPPGGFPAATFGINVLGCALIGVLMAAVTELSAPHRLLRPFLGVGVLGGFTTFSTFAAETLGLLRSGAVVPGLLYLIGTPPAALAAVLLGVAGTRAAFRHVPDGRGQGKMR